MKSLVKYTLIAATVGTLSVSAAEAKFSFSSVFSSVKKAVSHVVSNKELIGNVFNLAKKAAPGVLSIGQKLVSGDHKGALEDAKVLALQHGPEALGLGKEVLSVGKGVLSDIKTK